MNEEQEAALARLNDNYGIATYKLADDGIVYGKDDDGDEFCIFVDGGVAWKGANDA